FIDMDRPGALYSLPGEGASPDVPTSKAGAGLGHHAGNALTVESTGLQTLFQDLGRPGYTGMGVSASGALDRGALRRANRIVGNPSDTPALENLLGGLRLRCQGHVVAAVTGARVSLTLTDAEGRSWPAAMDRPLALDDGDVLTIGFP